MTPPQLSIQLPPSPDTCITGGRKPIGVRRHTLSQRIKHHLETIYWTFATRYQLNTELSILCLHPNSRDRLHFITLRGGNVTGLCKAHAVLEVILAFGFRIIHEKNESASKNVRRHSPSSPEAQKRKPTQRSDRRRPTERELRCVVRTGESKRKAKSKVMNMKWILEEKWQLVIKGHLASPTPRDRGYKLKLWLKIKQDFGPILFHFKTGKILIERKRKKMALFSLLNWDLEYQLQWNWSQP